MSLKEYASRKIRRDTAANWALNNPIPLQGEWCLETDTGNVKIGDGLRAWNDLGYRQRLAIPYTLTSNKTHTLPAITGFPQTESVYWTGGGTYKLRIKRDDGTYLDYEGEGEGHILVESDGSNWQVREYEDSGNIADSGNNYDRTYIKRMRTLLCKGRLTSTTNNNAGTLATFAHTFSSIPIMNALHKGIPSTQLNASAVTEVGVVSTISCTLKVTLHTPTTIGDITNGDIGYTANGAWA